MMRERVLTRTGAFRAWWSVAIVTVSALLVAGACVFYTNQQQRQSDRRWCELLTTLDQPTPAPTTARGREIQRQIHRLRLDLGCEVR
ncbi:hypothetical protein AB0C69_11065 [Actinomadura sp. NPDC048032]|uniref:hypothetical protein n=1 Tax=Actinomadura sp. NPDC048032 TaxID=3155747 RepID=UPI00340FF1EE